MAIVPQIIQFGGGGLGASRNIDSTDLQSAYSLSRLRSAYIGDAIRVRRSSDNVEQDIGFSGQNLDETGLLNFVGTGGTDNGFIVTWYDQSGNSNDVIQATTSRQPLIVSSGSVVKSNGKPTIDFTTNNTRFLRVLGSTYSQPNTFFIVTENNGSPPQHSLCDGRTAGSSNNIRHGTTTPRITLYAGTYIATGAQFTGNQDLLTVLFNTTSSNAWLNSSQFLNNGNLGSQSYALGIIGTEVTGAYGVNHYISEFLFYSTNKSSNRTAIETNINDYYSIYT